MKKTRKTLLSLLLTLLCATCLVSTTVFSYGCTDNVDSSTNNPYDGDEGWTPDY